MGKRKQKDSLPVRPVHAHARAIGPEGPLLTPWLPAETRAILLCLCVDSLLMGKLGVQRNKNVKPVSHRHAGPEIAAEKAEEKRFEQARREDKIISDVRTKIDKRK